MLIKSLDDIDSSAKVFLVQTPSEKMQMFLEDKIKRQLGSNRDTIIDVVNKKDIKKVKDIMNFVPPSAKKWYIFVDLKKLGVTEDLRKLVNESTTCVFFCVADKYVTFKKCKELFNKSEKVYDFYLTMLRRPDMVYLYSALVPSSNQLSKQLFDYVAQSYSSDIEAVFELFLELAKGTEIKNRRAIADICGVGGNSVEGFIFSLMKQPPVTEKGVKTVIKNRLIAGIDLSEVYGARTFRAYLVSTLRKFIDIKVLIMSGVVYKTIKDLPKGYDEQALVKYQKFIWRLNEIPMTRLLRCLYFLNQTRMWYSDMDVIKFIYNFILDTQRHEVLPYIEILKVDERIENDTKSIDEAEELYDFEEFRLKEVRDYSQDALDRLYEIGVKQGLVKPVESESDTIEEVEVEKKIDTSTLCSLSDYFDENDTRSALDIAMLISQGSSLKASIPDGQVVEEPVAEEVVEEPKKDFALEYMRNYFGG